MLDERIRAALLRVVEDPQTDGTALAALLAAIASHGAPEWRGAFDDLARGSGATDAAELTAWVRGERARWRPLLELGDSPLDTLALHAFTAAQSPTPESLFAVACAMLRVGFIDPEATLPVYERLADGWLRGKAATRLVTVDWAAHEARPLDAVRTALALPPPAPVDAAAEARALELLAQPGKLPAGLPPLFWQVVGQQVDPATITPTIAAFGATYDDRLKDACARAVLLHEGQAAIAREPWPPRVVIDSLAGYPPDTLGYDYYHLIVDNGFDPEVLDPDSVTGFHPGLDGTNRRILQQHEIWHLVAGYSTSPLHETAISGFQLAQFGHNYSATFLATVATLLLCSTPLFADPMLQVTFEGWRHGRATPPLMGIDWAREWGKSIATIRAERGIAAFESIIPDLAM